MVPDHSNNTASAIRNGTPTFVQLLHAGRRVAIQIGERRVEGRAESLDSDSALLLRTQHGHLELIIGGDVTVVP
jgi:biotin-(acetyl-CoA carboxylase) ligase